MLYHYVLKYKELLYSILMYKWHLYLGSERYLFSRSPEDLEEKKKNCSTRTDCCAPIVILLLFRKHNRVRTRRVLYSGSAYRRPTQRSRLYLLQQANILPVRMTIGQHGLAFARSLYVSLPATVPHIYSCLLYTSPSPRD